MYINELVTGMRIVNGGSRTAGIHLRQPSQGPDTDEGRATHATWDALMRPLIT